MDKSILEVVHETADALQKSELIESVTLREFDALCLPPVKEYSSTEIQQIRVQNKASQAVFAEYLNISKSTVQKWEQGHKRPSGASLKLLNLVDTKGLDALV